MKALVTGGGGFIGSNVVGRSSRAATTCACSTFSTGSRANLAGLGHDVQLVEGDLRSYERAQRFEGPRSSFTGCTAVGPPLGQDPLTTTAVNIEGTLNVLLAARDEGVRRIVNASSSSVYGVPARSRRPRRRRPTRSPRMPLRSWRPSSSARASAASAGWRSSRFATSTSSGRGRTRPPSTRRSCCSSSARSPRGRDHLRRRRPVPGLHVRRQRRRANLLAADAPGVGGEILNVATGESVTVNALADAIGSDARQAGREVVRAGEEADVRASWADVGEARRLLGYETRVDFMEGLRRTADYLIPERT